MNLNLEIDEQSPDSAPDGRSGEAGRMQQGNSMAVGTKQRRDRGAMLLAVLFMMAMLVLALLAVTPAVIQQAKRDREEEMIHRGTEYARAVRKYYKKFGRYPANIEQLRNTNQIRFLRKPYSDPLAKDGQWKLLHYADIASLVGGVAVGYGPGPGGNTPGGLQGSNPGNALFAGGQPPSQQQGTISSGPLQSGMQQTGQNPNAQDDNSGALSAQSGFALGQGPAQDTGAGSGQPQGPGGTGQTGSNNTIFGNTGVGGQTFGGGGIVGVASKSKDPTIRIYNKKRTYDEWMFIYSPMMERQNGLLRGPYNGMTLVGMPVGIPAGQMNQGQGSPQEAAPGIQLPQNQLQNQNQQAPSGNAFPPYQAQPQ